MNVTDIKTEKKSSDRGIFKTLMIALPMLFLTAFMLIGQGGLPGDLLHSIPMVITFLFMNVIFFMIIHTGRTDRFRSIFFITMALCFTISFIANLIEVRGSMALSEENMLKGEAPFCHMVIPMTIIPAAFTKTIIFPGSILEGYAPVATMFVFWIGASLVLGRGFCSWACFYGGLEDGFSRLRRKAVLKKIPGKWSYLPYGVLGAIVLISAMTLSPTYCEWLCPFKTVTEYVEVTSFKTMIQAVIFLSLFIGLVIVLPILTKKRTQCGLFCPMGAFQSFTNRAAPFEVRIDKDKCKNCRLCERICPTFSMDFRSIAEGRTRITCTKCGKCVDHCPENAISFHIKGTPVAPGSGKARMLFIFPAFLFLSTFGGSFIQDGIYRGLLLVTSGSMIQ